MPPASGPIGAAGSGGGAGRRRRLPERPGGAARPAGAVRPGGLDPDRLADIERTAEDADGLARLRAAGRTPVPVPGPRVATPTSRCWWWTRTRRTLAHTDAKEGAAGTYKHNLWFAPLLARIWTVGRRPRSRWPACCGRATPLRRGRGPGRAVRPRPGPGTCASAASGFTLGMQVDAMCARRSLPSPSRPGRRRSSPTARSVTAPRCAS